jgi:DNA-binding NarL/FixJ family response regulator
VIRVAIADDQPPQRAGFRMVLESQPDVEVVGEAGDGAGLLALVRRRPTDVVLMDIQMPRVNGLVAAARIAQDEAVAALQGRVPRVVLVTAVDLDDHLPAAADAGVFAVLYKDADPEHLLDTVRAAAAAPSFSHHGEN